MAEKQICRVQPRKSPSSMTCERASGPIQNYLLPYAPRNLDGEPAIAMKPAFVLAQSRYKNDQRCLGVKAARLRIITQT